VSERSDSSPAASLAEAIGYEFADASLAELALSHPSYAHEVDGSRGNERLEFLGDAVLDLVVSELQFQLHPDWTEGDLSRSRAALVNKSALAERARALGVDRFVLLGRTERRSSGQRKDSVLSNCLEAIIGAMYLDGGLAPVRAWVATTFEDGFAAGGEPSSRDAKTHFQEWAHAKLQTTPRYRTVSDSGTENDEERFTVEAVVADEVWGVGVGRSKRVAERDAARAALERSEATDE
jgi:ribonuclease-3